MKILVVEDMPVAQRNATEFLSSVGVESTIVANYNDFKKVFKINNLTETTNHQFDGIITELFFPVIDGYEWQPFGLTVYFWARNIQKIPCVICSKDISVGNGWIMHLAETDTSLDEDIIIWKKWDLAYQRLLEKINKDR